MKKGFAQIIIVAVIALVIGAVAVFGYQKYIQKPTLAPTQSPSNSDKITNQNSPSPATSEETANWKTYASTKYGYLIKYPKDWNIQSPGGGQFGDECKSADVNSEIIELASKDHKSCGFLGDYIPSDHVEIIIRTLSTPYSEIPGSEKITFAGQTATKYKFTKDSEGPAPTATIITFGRNNMSYSIYVQQPGIGIDYDPFLDQILSTFRFI